MSDQPSGSAGASSSGSGSNPPKAIASLAKKQNDVTRLGTQKLKFVPTLPTRREDPAPSTPTERGRGRGRGADRGRARGRGGGGGGEGGGGRGAAPRPPAVEMTASGPFAMGPALAGTSARRAAPRSNFAPIVPQGPGAARLGAGLTATTAPTLKRERDAEGGKGGGGGGAGVADGEVYSDPDEGVEIVDMENVRQMDWMAPESLRKERDAGKRKGPKVKKEERDEGKLPGGVSGETMDVDRQESPEEEEVNMANAVDLSESEEEEELEDIIDDFAQRQAEAEEDTDVRQERLYFFQFPNPFPAFTSAQAPDGDAKGKGKAADAGEDAGKKVTFAQDTKPPAPGAAPPAPSATEKQEAQTKVDGIVGQLEIYESGTVKLRLGNGIVMDVTAATQPSFLQHAVYVDPEHKRLSVLGEVNRRFVVTPDIETLLTSMELADRPPAFDLGDGLLTMDTT
ncbi:RNA polymerase III RPC4-domain-containing protein [Trametes meyenii]|nr:RNA polymerase III RPC4-domain-containing protein [Trametes meyenii]